MKSAEEVAQAVCDAHVFKLDHRSPDRLVVDISDRNDLVKAVGEALTAYADERVNEALQRKQGDKFNNKQMDYAVMKARAEALEEAAKHFENLSYKKIGLDMVIAKLRALRSTPAPGGANPTMPTPTHGATRDKPGEAKTTTICWTCMHYQVWHKDGRYGCDYSGDGKLCDCREFKLK